MKRWTEKELQRKVRIYIGIDTGVETGVAVYDRSQKRLIAVKSMPIHRAMELVYNVYKENFGNVFVRFEDARLRKWFGKTGREKLQGAGSVKRDAKIWEDFLTDNHIPFEAVAPKNNKTKMRADTFARYTGWKGRTNGHARDAAWLVVGL